MEPALFGRIVRVEARFEDGEPKIGTGFRLAPGRILTAQHVLEDRPGRGGSVRASEISVSLDPDGSGELLEGRAEVIWRGEEELDPEDPRALDAALLEDSLPAGELEPFDRLVRLPQPGGKFEGAGFVKASASHRELHRPDGLSGGFDPVQKLATCLGLQVEGLAPRRRDGGEPWGGTSGAPIFIASDQRHAGSLYGVIRRRIESFGDRVWAVATPALLRDPGFREALGISDTPPPHERLVVASRELLERNPRIARRLARQDPVWADAWAEQGTEGLLEAVCRQGDVGTLLDGLRVLAEASAGEPGDLRSLRDSAAHLVALLAHHELVRQAGIEEAAPGRFKVPVTSLNFAEAAFASTEGRKARYARPDRAAGGRRGFAARELEIPSSRLESGLELRKAAADHVEELAARLVEEDLGEAPFFFDEQNQAIAGAPEAERIRLLSKAIDANLVRLARKKGGRPYLSLTPDRRKRLGLHLEEFLEHLRGLLPSLIYLELHGDPEQGLDLERKLQPLWEILGIEDE